MFGDMPNDDAVTLEVIRGTDVGNYWLSSRFVHADSGDAYFNMRWVSGGSGGVGSRDLFISEGSENMRGLPLRAVITIPASDLVEHAGTKSNPHIIQY